MVQIEKNIRNPGYSGKSGILYPLLGGDLTFEKVT